MRRYALALLVSIAIPAKASADEKVDCVAAHEEGQVARREGHFNRAREAFAACERDVCPAAVRTRCSDFARELETAQPTVVLVVRNAQGSDAAGAHVIVDGAAAIEVSGMGLRLNPGPHTFRVEAPGYLPSEKTFTLSEGVKNTQAIFSLETPAGAAPLPSAAPDASARSTTTAAWAFTIGSGVSLLAAGGLSGAGWATHESLKSSCGAAGCSDGQVEPLRILWPASFVALGVGVVSGVIAVVLFAQHSGESSPSALVVAPDGAGIRF